VQLGFSQTIWKAELPVVEKNDYYNIELDQKLIGAGLNYLKILDDNDMEAPYFIRSTDPIQEISNFESFDLEINTTKDSLNIIIVNNKQIENLNRFCIILQQADTRKYVYVRGSNDLQQWYIVKQQTRVSEFTKPTKDNDEMLIIDFPQGNYKYYEITLWNDQQSPLEVRKVGKIKNSNIYGNFVEIETGKFVTVNNTEKKNTTISFPELNFSYCINKIEFGIKNKPDYYRKAILIDSVSFNKEQFNLSSRNDNALLINDFNYNSQSFIVIENQNNPPVVIDSVKIYGLSRYACVYLEAGRKYHLLIDSKNTTSTKYDIEYFRNKIPADLTVLKTVNIHSIPETTAPEREITLIEQPVFLWSVIILIGLFLVYICVRMIKKIT
jgi:hypothetical protein